jgi:hypothetical protein
MVDILLNHLQELGRPLIRNTHRSISDQWTRRMMTMNEDDCG